MDIEGFYDDFTSDEELNINDSNGGSQLANAQTGSGAKKDQNVESPDEGKGLFGGELPTSVDDSSRHGRRFGMQATAPKLTLDVPQRTGKSNQNIVKSSINWEHDETGESDSQSDNTTSSGGTGDEATPPRDDHQYLSPSTKSVPLKIKIKLLKDEHSGPVSSVPVTKYGHDGRIPFSDVTVKPPLKSCMKRRGSDPASDRNRKRSTLFKVPDGENERTKLLTPDRSDDERRVSYTLPDGAESGASRSSIYGGGKLQVYGMRLYVLFIFCAFSFIYGVIWNTLGSVAKTAEVVLHFNNGDIALIANWGPIGFVVTCSIYTLLIQRKGLRWACLFSATLLFLGACVRVLVVLDRSTAKWAFHFGHCLIGCARFMTQVAPPVLSATWFRAGERTTATATAILMPQLGMSLFSVIEPYIVEDIGRKPTVTTTPMPNASISDVITSESPSEGKINRIFFEILDVMYIHLVLAGGICLAMWIYFPARPPTPPTRSAGLMRMALRRGIRIAFRNKNLWLLAIPANTVSGVLVGWISLLDLNIQQAKIQQSVCGWLIFGNVFGGMAAGLIIARISDNKVYRMKPLLISLMCCGSISLLLFTLQVNKVIPSRKDAIYVTCIMVGLFMYAAIPLICEISAELAYPVQEHVTLLIDMSIMSFATFLYLLVPLFRGVGVYWMNWTFLAVTCTAIPFIICYKQKYKRAEHDKFLEEEGAGTHRVDEWLRNGGPMENEEPLLSGTMGVNWVDDTRRGSTGTTTSIQEDDRRLLKWYSDDGLDGRTEKSRTNDVI